MGRERFESISARVPGRIVSFLDHGRQIASRRRLERSTPINIDVIPKDQEIVLMVDPNPRECLDTKVFDGALHSPQPSRLHPNV